jgi:four helix bundle protein
LENVIEKKSYAFAVRIGKMYRHLHDVKKEVVLSRQVLRSGTSIGANVEEAIGAQSKADFIAKLTIAYKETRETMFWLDLLHDIGYLTDCGHRSIYADALELRRILSSIIKTSKESC